MSKVVRLGRPKLNLGDLTIMLLLGNLASLRDYLHEEGFDDAADLLADLVDIADDYVVRIEPS